MKSNGLNTWVANAGNGLHIVWYQKLRKIKIIHKSRITGDFEVMREVPTDPEMKVSTFEKLIKDTLDTIK